MRVDQAVELLWKAGYRANASTTIPNSVVVLDPVHCRRGNEPLRIEYERRVVHASRVHAFISERG
jgi:hypothetical protein